MTSFMALTHAAASATYAPALPAGFFAGWPDPEVVVAVERLVAASSSDVDRASFCAGRTTR